MNLRLTQRQLDALRADAIEEGRSIERRESIQRDIDRSMSRQRWYGRVEFAVWADACEGTVLIATEDGSGFYKYARIERVLSEGEDTGSGTVRDGHMWVEYTLFQGGTGGSTVRPTDRIVVMGGTTR